MSDTQEVSMSRQHRTPKGFFYAASALLLCCAGSVWAQTTAFTYQGQLTDAGNPANGNYDLQFKLFDTPTVATGAQQGATLVRNPTAVSAGVFTVTLDFGANPFGGQDRYLEIGVRPAGGANAYTVLAARQPITSSPYAIQTLNAQQLGGLRANRYLTRAANGKIGVGTDAPEQTLQVDGVTSMGPPGSVYGFLVNGAAPGPFPTLGFNTYGPSYLAGVSGYGGLLQFQDGDGSLRYYTDATSHAAGQSHSLTPRFTILRDGTVGIGITNPTSARLNVTIDSGNAVYGVSTDGRGVWGQSTSGQGVYGKSDSNAGVVGEANKFPGVYGVSHDYRSAGVFGTNDDFGSGVYGESKAIDTTSAAGVYGKGLGGGGIGVIGEANVDTAVGVFGVSSSNTGYGVYARNTSGGRALHVDGNATQELNTNGLVKAMVETTFNADGVHVLSKCYNGVTNTSTGNCGFAFSGPLHGVARINFGFPIRNRFFSVSALYKGITSGNNSGVNYRLFDDTTMEVFTFEAGNGADTEQRGFTLIMY